MLVRILAGCIVLFVATTRVASAQLVSPPNGITVTGRGVVRVHADEMRFNAVLVTGSSRMPGVSVTPTPADLDGAADAIAKALREAGVADAAAGFSGIFNVNGPRSVTGSLRHPTRDGVDALLREGNAAAAPFPNVVLQNINVSFLVDDCGVPEMRAQTAALADARHRAEQAARAAGVGIGAVLSVNEGAAYAGNGGPNCATRPDTQPFSGQVPGPVDAATLGDVFVSVNATVTFAIAR